MSAQDTSPSAMAEKQEQHQPRVRRRNRLITSCLECRRRKLKCDKGQPCSNCTKLARPCVFIAPGLDAGAQARLTEVKEKMGLLEQSLEKDVARRALVADGSSATPNGTLPGQGESYSDQEDDEDTKNLKSTDFALEDAVYCEEEGEDNDMVDLGIALGKVRVTERMGGLVRPKLSEELKRALKDLPQRGASRDTHHLTVNSSWMAPSSSYIPPSSSFFFAPGVQKSTLSVHLPSKIMVDKLMAHYWVAVHVVARALHRPSFEKMYQKFWMDINIGIEPRNSFQAVVFSALLGSVTSMSEDQVVVDFGISKKSLVDNFREGAEAALARANFLSTTKLETLQAFVMYMLPLCRLEVSRAHTALVGSLIRLAECMGLHRDPSAYTSSVVEVHVRRLLWYQICFLDMRTCEATGPRPQLRPDDFDTRFPINIDDEDLDRVDRGDSGVDARRDSARFTDMTLMLMRFESHEMQRLVWFERPKLDQKRADGRRKTTLTGLLSRIQSFCAAMEKKYLPMLDRSQPQHVLAAQMYGIISNRLYIMALTKYMSADTYKMPERLRQIMMGASFMALEHSMTIEQHPALVQWSWYVGALHQYHMALVLANELYAGPREPILEERAWKVLDFAFDMPSGIPNIEKMRTILEDLIEKTTMYANIRKARAPSKTLVKAAEGHAALPEMRLRDQKAVNENGKISSEVWSSSSGISPPPNHVIPQYAQPQLQPSSRPRPMFSFPGAMPTVDWGSAHDDALSADAQSRYAASDSPGLISNKALAAKARASPGTDTVQSHDKGPLFTTHGSSASPVDTNMPMDMLADIDWNDFDRIFGIDTNVSAGDMIIPPFTFPQFYTPTSEQDSYFAMQ